MSPEKRLPVHRRLGSVLRRGHLSVALVAVVLASTSMTLLGTLALKVYADNNVHLLARAINYTVEAAVVFDDKAAASEALALIASTAAVADAQVYKANGQLLAQWHRPETGLWANAEMLLADCLLNQPVIVPIERQGQQIGEVRVRTHGASLLRFLISGLFGVLLCTALSVWSALHLSRRMHGGITGPLQQLAEVAHAVRIKRAFDRRVPAAQIGLVCQRLVLMLQMALPRLQLVEQRVEVIAQAVQLGNLRCRHASVECALDAHRVRHFGQLLQWPGYSAMHAP